MVPFTFGTEPLQEGTSASLQCTVSEGDLPLHITWLFNGEEIEDSDTISISKLGRRGSALTIDSVTSANVGNYTCSIKNPVGSETYTAPLLVNG